MDVRVVPLVDRLDLVDVVASWHWEQWGADDPDGSLESWTARLGSWANGDAIPSLYVALDEGRPAGSVSLVAHDLPEERDLWDLWPWLSGLFVVPDRRGRGLARALVAHVEHAARHLGVSRLYLHTVDARGLYEHLGWEIIGRLPVAGRLVDLMAKRLIPGSEDPTEQAWLRTLRPSRIRDVQAGELSWTTVDVVDCTSGDEAGAIRAVLEHLGVRVNLVRVGQARHLIHALERGDAAWLVLCVQGDGGRILLPDLAPQVERFQPWHGSVGPAEIAASFGWPGCQVFCTGARPVPRSSPPRFSTRAHRVTSLPPAHRSATHRWSSSTWCSTGSSRVATWRRRWRRSRSSTTSWRCGGSGRRLVPGGFRGDDLLRRRRFDDAAVGEQNQAG